MAHWSKRAVNDKTLTCVRDVFLTVFAPKGNGKGKSALSSIDGPHSFPRFVAAGARPGFFALRTKGKDGEDNAFSPAEVRKWKKDSSYWAHRIKRKAAVSWNKS